VVILRLFVAIHRNKYPQSLISIVNIKAPERSTGAIPVKESKGAREGVHGAISPGVTSPLKVNQVAEGFVRGQCPSSSYEATRPPIQCALEFRDHIFPGGGRRGASTEKVSIINKGKTHQVDGL